MTDLQRYGVLSSDGEFVYMQKYDDGKWVLYDDAQAEIARLLLRIADLEAAKPVATVLAAQIDDVAEATVDYPIPSSMDVRRHPITQCLIAAIADNAQLRVELQSIEGCHRSMSREFRKQRDETIPKLRERETILNTTNANLHDEIARLRDALGEISKGAGPFSHDPLTHARDCIECMKATAMAALGDAPDA